MRFKRLLSERAELVTQLRALEFGHFLSYRVSQTLSLPSQGLVLVRGENQVSQAADSNGAGKSAVFDALSFALFGVTLRGKRGEDVACRFTREPGWVRLTLEDAEGQWVVFRQVRPKQFRLSGFPLSGGEDERELQGKLESRLGFGLRSFRNAIVFGQGTFERFAQADQADQLRMLDEIQGLDLRGALDRAKRWRDDTARALDDLSRDLSGLAREREVHLCHLREFEEAQAKFQQEKTQRMDRLTREEADLTGSLQSTREVLARFPERQRVVEGRRAQWTQILALQKQVDSLTATLRLAEQERATAQSGMEELEAQVRELLAARRCPTCRRSLKEGHQEVRAAFAPDLRSRKAFLVKCDRVVTQCRQKVYGVTQRLAELTRAGSGLTETQLLREEQEVSAAVQARYQAEAADVSDRLQRCQEEIELERARQWEGEVSRVALRRTLQELEHRQASTLETQNRLGRTLRVAEYWVEAFGDRGVRSLLFDSAAFFLNERLLHHLTLLAGGEAQVTVSALTTLKSGGVRDRISIGSTWQWGGEGVGVGSAGQDRRVDLALFAALQDLAEFRSARPFPLRVYDEPFDALDATGKECAARWARREAAQRAVFLITHSQELENLLEPDQVWAVILDNYGSRIECK